MKKLKTFEEMGYGNTPLSYDTEAELNMEENPDSFITPNALTDMVNAIYDSSDNIEEVTAQLSALKQKYPQIKEDDELRKLWFKLLKRWHQMLDQVGGLGGLKN